MNANCQKLLWDIIKCGMNNCPLPNSDCYPIYQSQNCNTVGDFQVPEPWSGDIENAPILFVGINPGFTPGELYPKLNNPYWTDPNSPGLFDLSKVEDFFENRFNNDKNTHPNPYVKITNQQGKLSFSVRMNDGSYKNVQGYWNYIQSISDCLLKRPTTPGIDYALTELVHCKSANIRGIKTGCYKKCANSFFNDILSVATNLQYLIVIGAQTRKYVATLLNHCDPNHPTNPTKYICYSTTINGKNVNVLYADHNAGGGTVKKFPG